MYRLHIDLSYTSLKPSFHKTKTGINRVRCVVVYLLKTMIRSTGTCSTRYLPRGRIMYGCSNNIPCTCFSADRFVQPTTGLSLCILVLFNLFTLYIYRKGNTCPVRLHSILDTAYCTRVQVCTWYLS